MKRVIRSSVFETNSSSTHCICIPSNDVTVNIPEHIVFEEGEFGWETAVYDDTHSKASYLYTALKETMEDDLKDKMLKILDELGVTYEFIDIDDEYGGYIDHVYETIDFVNAVCNNKDLLVKYLFSDMSYIGTGNDNSDEGYAIKENANYPVIEFYKGN